MSEETVEISIPVTVPAECVVDNYQTLLNAVYDAETMYNYHKGKYEQKEADLWLNTDFKEVLDKAKPTETDKKMFLKEQLALLKADRDSAKANLDDLKRMYEISLKYGLEALK